jgi:hypothetical protein
MKKHLFSLIAFAVPALGFGSSALGVVTQFDITNNSGAARSDLHLEFPGTGQTARLTVIVNAAGCAAMPVVTNPGTPWDITWPNPPCVAVGDTIRVSINSEGAVAFSDGNWTPPGGNVALVAGDVVIHVCSGACGACCNTATNDCFQLTDAECKDLGFTFRGAGTPCGADGTCIPTLSEWGVAVMAMLVLTAGTIVVMRRRAAATT